MKFIRFCSLSLMIMFVAILLTTSTSSAQIGPLIADSFDYPLDPSLYGTQSILDNITTYGVPNPLGVPASLSGCFGEPRNTLNHAGEDWYYRSNISLGQGKIVHAVANGQVSFYGESTNYPGQSLVLKHFLPNGQTVYSVYEHLENLTLPLKPTATNPYPSVVKGQDIGTIMYQHFHNDPNRDDSHLHWEIRIYPSVEFLCGTSESPPGVGYVLKEQHPDDRGYINPSRFIASTRVTDKVVLFTMSHFRGNTFNLANNPYAIDLSQVSGGRYDNSLLSIAIPQGWTVKLYQNRPGTSGGTKLLTQSDYNLVGDYFDNGVSVWDNVTYVERVTSTNNPPDPNPTPLPASAGIGVVSVGSYVVSPGQTFAPSVIIRSVTGQLNTSDYLHAVPESSNNTFGAWPTQGVHHLVATGNNYTFQAPQHPQFMMTAPQQTGTYQSVWRLNVNNVDVGPQIVIPITVRTVSNPHPIDFWNMDVFTNKDLSGSAAFHTTFTDQYIFKNWGIGSPAGNVPVDNWSARFVRENNFPGGEYRFHCQHDDGCRMYIDGEKKLDAWWNSSFDGHDWTGFVSAGLHEVKVEFYDQGGDARLDFWWQGPGFFPRFPSCEPDLWCAEYYGNNLASGIAPVMRSEGAGNLNVGLGNSSPATGIPSDNFSARFTKMVAFSCGTYRFHITADDGDRFYIDDQLILDEWTNKAQYTTNVDVTLAEGDHKLTFYYREAAGDAVIRYTVDQLTTCAPYSGNLVVLPGQTMYVNSIATSVSASGNVANVGNSAKFYSGDIVLLHQTQDAVNAGVWETATIQAVSSNVITFTSVLHNSYNSSPGHAQIVKIPQYSSVTVQNGGTLTAFPWNGTTGGVLTFSSNGTVTIDGAVDASGKGFRGGDGSKRTLNRTGQQGESYNGLGATCGSNNCNVNSNNFGGGGSGGNFGNGSGGGAGGSYGTLGTTAPTGSPVAGAVYGNTTITNLHFGSGGGGGYDNGNGAVGGSGGNGGGMILISAASLQVNGTIKSYGANGGGTASYAGGGGSGGSIYLIASTVNIGSDHVTAYVDNTGLSSGGSGGNGGSGGAGRIWIKYCTYTGTTSPGANTQQECPQTSQTPTPTSTPAPGINGVELLSAPWHLEGNNGSAELYDGFPYGALQGKNMLRITYNLHGLQALGNDASAIIFDQNGWKYISLSNYGQNGLDGVQTVDIPLSAFTGLDTNASVNSIHTRFWYGSAFVVDITSIVAYTSGGSTPTPVPTPTPVHTATPTPGNSQDIELLSAPWHLEGNNGSAELYQGISATSLQGKAALRITYNLHGLQALGGDASAIIFDQNGWKYISLSNYGQNGLNGVQTVVIPLSHFTGLDTNAGITSLHTRFWYSGPFTVDITSIVATTSVNAAQSLPGNNVYLPLIEQ